MVFALYDEVRVFGRTEKYRVIESVFGDSHVTVQNMDTNSYTDVPIESLSLFKDTQKDLGIYDEVLMVDNRIDMDYIVCDTNERMGILEVERSIGDTGKPIKTFYVNPKQIKKIW